MSKEEYKTCVVLGMHRSGTSMIAGCLHTLDIKMGENLVGESKYNPLGHYEDEDFLRLNKEILDSAGGDWLNPPSRKKILAQKTKFNEEIKNLVEKKKERLWGWKDPRTSLTIDLYLPFLDDVYLIICYRDKDAVADSLNRRSGRPLEVGIKLKELYDARIKETKDQNPEIPALKIKYEKTLENPKETIDRIVRFLDINPSQSSYEDSVKFIKPKNKIRFLSKTQLLRGYLKGGYRLLKNPKEIPKYFRDKIN